MEIVIPYLQISGQIGAEIFKRALTYPARLIAKNAGVNDSVVIEKVSLWASFDIKKFLGFCTNFMTWSLFQT